MNFNQFAMVPLEVLRDERLTKIQLKVLIALFSIRDRKADTMYVKREKIAERCGYSPRTVTKTTTQLVDLGWLEKVGRGGFSKPSEYRIVMVDPQILIDQNLAKTVADSGTENPINRSNNGVRTGNGSRTGAITLDIEGRENQEASIHAACSDGETVPEPGTVADSGTVPESVSKTVPEPVSKTVADSDRGNIHTTIRPYSDHEASASSASPKVDGIRINPQDRVTVSIDWRPNDYIFKELKMKFGIPAFFFDDCLFNFVLYHNGSEKRHAEFEKRLAAWVRRDWQNFKHTMDGMEDPKPMSSDWLPADVALQMLSTEGMGEVWALNQVPEFKLYWTDRKVARDNWNHLFVNHCRHVQKHGSSSIGAGGKVAQLTDRGWSE